MTQAENKPRAMVYIDADLTTPSLSAGQPFNYIVTLVIVDFADSDKLKISIKTVDSSYISCDPFYTIETDQIVEKFNLNCQLSSLAPVGSVVDPPKIELSLNDELIELTTEPTAIRVEQGLSSYDSEFLGTSFSILQHPNRVLNGITYELNNQILTRPRSDNADLTYTEIQLSQPPHDSSYFVYPEPNGEGIKAHFYYENRELANHSVCGRRNHICRAVVGSCTGKCTFVPSACGVVYYTDVDKARPPTVRFYNPSSTSPVYHLSDLHSDPISVEITGQLPEGYPTLEYTANQKSDYKKSYSINASLSQSKFNDANDFIRDGGAFYFPQTDFESRALINGRSGQLKTEISGLVNRTEWVYKEFKKDQLTCEYQIRHCPKEGPCYYSDHTLPIYVPAYRWEMTSQKSIEFEDFDTANVDVFSSTAWIQTKGGNMGTNNQISSEGNEFNVFKYADSEVFWDGARTGSSSKTEPKNYAPLNQHNAEFMIFAKGTNQRSDANITEFSSELNWYQEIPSDLTGQSQSRYGYGLRGEEYDRPQEDYPRVYKEDLIDRQLFGEVIDFSVDEVQANLSRFGGVKLVGSTFFITKDFILERGKIYYFPLPYKVQMGSQNEDLILKGSSARLQVDSEVKIIGNIAYNSYEAVNYLEIPNLRIDADSIKVEGHVEYIESQLKARYFSSGDSELQLRILGDLIAEETHFQRRPTNLFDSSTMKVNPPSELIIEDLRKFIIPAPGDTILRDSYEVWQQVNPLTGEVVDPY